MDPDRDNEGREPLDLESVEAADIVKISDIESRLKESETSNQPSHFIAVEVNEHFEPTVELSGGVKVSYVDAYQESGGTRFAQGSRVQRQSGPESTKNAGNDVALTFKTFYNLQKQRERTLVKIHSAALLQLLRFLTRDITSHSTSKPWRDEVDEISTSDEVIEWAMDLLFEATGSDFPKFLDTFGPVETSEGTWKELCCFVQHIKTFESQKIAERHDQQKTATVKFDSLSSIYLPGLEVVAKPFLSEPQLFIVHSGRLDEFPENGRFHVHAWMYDWNGTKLTRQTYLFTIPNYQGSRSIKSLPCFPLEYYGDSDKDAESLLENLILRGKDFQGLCQKSSDMFCCDGRIYPALPQVQLFDSISDDPRIHDLDFEAAMTASILRAEERPVFIDPALFDQYTTGACRLGFLCPGLPSECRCKMCDPLGIRSFFQEKFGNIDDKTTPDAGDRKSLQDCFALLPPRVLGFESKTKNWGQFGVCSIKRLEKKSFQKEWDTMSLDLKHKQNIRDLVSAHFNHSLDHEERRVIRDFIPGKGEGVVILLHGVPGVGKTLTAETLARVLNRPLLRIGASDFRYNEPDQVDRTFVRYFSMAQTWETILLIDEADIFLQSRTRADIQQNGLVTVLLRHLEYFNGVLIMTTNRIMSVDIAVQSRITYAVRFDHLGEIELQQVWKYFADQLDASNSGKGEGERIQEWLEENIREMKRISFTGRDIRNLFHSAQLLASRDGGMINSKHIKEVFQCSKDFRMDLEQKRIQEEANTAASCR